MENRFVFDYYYGVEAVQFSFVKIPRFLFKDERFNSLSTDAKMLYSLMLERMYLSAENGWYDEEDRVYIIYSQEDIMKDIGCANGKSSTLVAELKNFGLIEKKKRGQGKKDITYVKNFTTLEPVVETENYLVSFSDKNVIRESRKSDFKKNENRISRNAKIESQEMRKSNLKKCENRISRNAKIKC